MTEAVATIEGTKLDARYTLLDKLGAGGQGEVWRAHDGTRGVDIALKLVKPAPERSEEAWRSLEHEYAIASRLDHPSILKVYPPERIGDVLVLPMELAAGGDLRRLRGSGFLEIIPVLLELAQALEHAHERGVVHRDLKPSNVLFDIRGRARLADFGVAEQAMTPVEAGDGAPAVAATRDTNRHGFSPFTASPAQLRGEPPTAADDIYGLGALAYELLSGYPPYYPRFDKKRAIEEPVPTLVPTRQIPPLLAALVMNMLAKQPKRRPRTMREVIDELDAAINDTLTYDFESVSSATPAAPGAPHAGAQTSARAEASPPGAAGTTSAPNAGASSASEPAPVWTPASKDRRASPDRRGRRKEDFPTSDSREPTISSDLSDIAADGSNVTGAHSKPVGSAKDANATGGIEQRARRSDNPNATGAFAAKSAGVADSNGSANRDAAAAFGSKSPGSAEPNATAAFHSNSPGSVDPNATRDFGSKSSGSADPNATTGFGSKSLGSADPNATIAFGSKSLGPADPDATLALRLKSPGSADPNATIAFGSKSPGSADPNATIAFGSKSPGSADPNATIAFGSKSLGSADPDATLALRSKSPGSADPNATLALRSKSSRSADPNATIAFDSKSPGSADPNATIAFDSGSVAPRGGNPASGSATGSRAPASPSRRTGADALARIDAALERAAADPSPWPKSGHPSITPEEAAAIVAAARAAGARPKAGGGTPTPSPAASGRTVPWRSPATSTHLLPPESPPPPGHISHGHATTAEPAISAAPAQSLSAHAAAAHVQSGPMHTGPMHTGPMHAGAMHTPASGHTVTAGPASMSAHAAAAPTQSAPGLGAPMNTGPIHASWEIPLDSLPRVARLQPIRPRRWPWVFLGLLAGAAAAVYFWLPQLDTQSLPPDVAAIVTPLKEALTPIASPASQNTTAQTNSSSGVDASGATTAGAAPVGSLAAAGSESADAATGPPSGGPSPTAGDEQRLREMRQTFDTRLASLEARGAGVWGGREFAMAKTRAAESVGARDAGNTRMAQERLVTALKLLDTVDSKAPQALAAQVSAGERALGAGQQEVAGQAFDLARRINPADRRVSDGQRRTQNLSAVLPLLADAQNAEAAREYARAAQDYSQALFLDPGNATAKAGQARANAAFGDDNYARAVGSGFAALGAGRLDEAHDAFVKARALKPNGADAVDGLRKVSAALTARGFASMRQRAVGLEAQERWEEALRAYEDVLAADPSLSFAQEGKARTSSRADLSIRLQQLLDRPDRLSSASVREDARALLETARAQSPQGPVIRSQIARLEIALPNFDKPVRLSLVSDNSTQIAIPSIGSFGTFARRDIELRPGRYTVVGTRSGFRDVRREITVAPGQEIQTIRVTCSDPI